MTGTDLLTVRGQRVLVANRMPTDDGGAVATLRDRTELEQLGRELDSTRGLIDALRAQDHEHANRMHTLLGLLELEMYEDAVEFVGEVVGDHRVTAEQVTEKIHDPLLAALLVGKATVAAERGVALWVSDRTRLPDRLVDPRGLVTVVGNLVDNALDAVAGTRTRAWRSSCARRDVPSSSGSATPGPESRRNSASWSSPRDGPRRSRRRTASAASGSPWCAGSPNGRVAARTVGERGRAAARSSRSSCPRHWPTPSRHARTAAGAPHADRRPDTVPPARRGVAMIEVLVVDDDTRVARVNAAYVEKVPGFQVGRPWRTTRRRRCGSWRRRPASTWFSWTTICPTRRGSRSSGEMRRRGHQTDVIMVTAARDVTTVQAAMRHGALQYLVKPFAFAGLRAKLEAYAELRRTLDGGGEAEQAEVDRIFGALSATVRAGLPKGHSPTTADAGARSP